MHMALWANPFIDGAYPSMVEEGREVPQLHNVAYPKHTEEEQTSPSRNHIITSNR